MGSGLTAPFGASTLQRAQHHVAAGGHGTSFLTGVQRQGEKDERDESERRKGAERLHKAEALQEGGGQLKMLQKGLCFLSPSNRCQQKAKGDGQKIVLVEEMGVLPSSPRWTPIPPFLGLLTDTNTTVLAPARLVFAPEGPSKRFGCFQPHSENLSCSLQLNSGQ